MLPKMFQLPSLVPAIFTYHRICRNAQQVRLPFFNRWIMHRISIHGLDIKVDVWELGPICSIAGRRRPISIATDFRTSGHPITEVVPISVVENECENDYKTDNRFQGHGTLLKLLTRPCVQRHE
jgi:hypothetical protein